MNLLDVFILLLLMLALRRGLRLGFVSLVLSALGFVTGLYLGSLLANALGGSIGDPIVRVMAALTLSIIVGFVLSGVGESVAMRLAEHLRRLRLHKANTIFGAAFEVLFVLLIVWLLASSLANVSTSNIGRQIRSSFVISTLNANLPHPPDLLSELERIIDGSGLPRAFIGNEPRRGPAPNTTPLGDDVIRSAQASVVQITGRGCGGVITGSGFVVNTDVIATNAHVVAGISRPRVQGQNGETYNATPIYFDPSMDFALLRVDNLQIPALPLTAQVTPDGTSIAIMGHPGGGRLTISGGAVIESLTARGRNIYDRGVVARDIYAVAATIESGNSGGPMIDGEGRAVGIVFAKSVSEDSVGYTIRSSEIIPAIEQYSPSRSGVSTGRCATS